MISCSFVQFRGEKSTWHWCFGQGQIFTNFAANFNVCWGGGLKKKQHQNHSLLCFVLLWRLLAGFFLTENFCFVQIDKTKSKNINLFWCKCLANIAKVSKRWDVAWDSLHKPQPAHSLHGMKNKFWQPPPNSYWITGEFFFKNKFDLQFFIHHALLNSFTIFLI